MGIIKKIFGASAARQTLSEFSEVSLAATDACHLKCKPCPIHYFTDEVPSKHASAEVIDSILPFLKSKNNLDLTGWGEPLLNPKIFDMIRKAKDAGVASVTLTTAAEVLRDDRCKKLIDAGLDSMTVSVDAASAERYTAIKGSGKFDDVRGAMKSMIAMRSNVGDGTKPYIQASFLMLADSMSEMPAFVKLMAEIGVDEVAFKNVNGVWDEETMQQVVYENYFPVEVDSLARDKYVSDSFAAGKSHNILVRIMNDFNARRIGKCFNDAEHRPFISITGEVSPCCILAYPVTRYSHGGEAIDSRPVSFGNVKETTLPEIWNSPEYIKFRNALAPNEKPSASGEEPIECRGCLALYSVSYFNDERANN